MMTELFQQALHIDSPWLIKSIDFDADKKRLDIYIDFKRGSTFSDPDTSTGIYPNEIKMQNLTPESYH